MSAKDFEGSLQHHEFFDGGHLTFARCESCMWGSHYEVVTWHSWMGPEDVEFAEEGGASRGDLDAMKAQKCACDCAGPKGAVA